MPDTPGKRNHEPEDVENVAKRMKLEVTNERIELLEKKLSCLTVSYYC